MYFIGKQIKKSVTFEEGSNRPSILTLYGPQPVCHLSHDSDNKPKNFHPESPVARCPRRSSIKWPGYLRDGKRLMNGFSTPEGRDMATDMGK
ncbi:hypothetical protein CEXT_796301 [Caerostris extrusa]|uniref:Uncharacterized protein n=1 Tax=Caerostris extrusa TaxID=172846 RepID=A0AAV4TH58_CAEEX|nr:hypothetical protein CEXT_796301 [Caerostris extrusa]